ENFCINNIYNMDQDDYPTFQYKSEDISDDILECNSIPIAPSSFLFYVIPNESSSSHNIEHLTSSSSSHNLEHFTLSSSSYNLEFSS
ncbi:14194_t:CDS:2, partial [Gigaspora rosea]